MVRETTLGAAREIRLEAPEEAVGAWDRSRLRQALTNLVVNAARHAAEASTITVTVACEEGASEAVVGVHNHGDPIPDDERELIFQPFRRAAPALAEDGRSGRRMGLGLYIARRMAEAHGGTVEVASSAAAGTTFRMRLPRQPPTPGAAPA